jgi:glycosyltransferase involved in cell wall biosynthesis
LTSSSGSSPRDSKRGRRLACHHVAGLAGERLRDLRALIEHGGRVEAGLPAVLERLLELILRLLVVSHPAILAVNQLPYAELRRHGWDPFVVTPNAWRNQYATAPFPPEVLPELAGRVAGRRVALAGRIQRHFYVTRIAGLIADVRPRAALIEEEPTSVPAFQWGRALWRARVPFAVQAAENLDRPWPLPARGLRRWTLAHAAFVVARSSSAAALVHRARPGLAAPVIPHHVPGWPVARRARGDAFVVGYAGRLVREKGLDVLIDAAAGLDRVIVRLVGDGPMRGELQARAARRSVRLEIDVGLRHDDMGAAYAGFDILVLPSRTTATWAEQFGRALVEALWCGVPVVGSDSGEIPRVIGSSRGGLVFREGDAAALREALVRLRDSPVLRRELAEQGSAHARAQFSVAAVSSRLDRALRGVTQLEPGSASSRA